MRIARVHACMSSLCVEPHNTKELVAYMRLIVNDVPPSRP